MSGLSIDEIERRTSDMAIRPADEMSGFFAYDVLVESQQGIARGLIGLEVSVIESMLRDLLISDPMPPLVLGSVSLARQIGRITYLRFIAVVRGPESAIAVWSWSEAGPEGGNRSELIFRTRRQYP